MFLYTTTPILTQLMIHAIARSCQFSYNKFVVIKRLNLILRTRHYLCKLCVCGLLFRKYRLQNFHIKQMLSRLDSLRHHVTLRNGKKYINFEIFDRSRHKLYFTNTYTLILEKNFRICERKKKYLLHKNYMINLVGTIQTVLGWTNKNKLKCGERFNIFY